MGESIRDGDSEIEHATLIIDENVNELNISSTQTPIIKSQSNNETPICQSNIETPISPTRINDNTTETPTKKYPSRRKTGTKTPKVRIIKPSKKELNNKKELEAIKAENEVLKNSLATLQDTISKQADEILEMKEEMCTKEKCIESKIQSSVHACEQRIMNFYTDQDKICLHRTKQLSSDMQRKLDKTTSKADNALKTAAASSSSPAVDQSEIYSKISNIEMEMEKLEHELVGMGNQLNDMITNNTAFESTNKTYKPNPIADQSKKKSGKIMNSSNSVMFCDSNRKHLIEEKLWRGITIIPCGSVLDLKSKIQDVDITSMNMLAIHVGVNDLDKKDGTIVFEELSKIVSDIKAQSPSIKLVVSEITPRHDGRDGEVLIFNALLKTHSLSSRFTLAIHENLRNSEWSFHDENDAKHLSKISIAKFAWNLKNAFRKAMGPKRQLSRNTWVNKTRKDTVKYEQRNKEDTRQSTKAELLRKLSDLLGI